MDQTNFTDDELKVYISYEYLTVEQLSKIMLAIDQLYQSVASAMIYGQLNYVRSSQMIIYPVPLCVSQIGTGNSVEFRFKFEKRFFPQVKFKDSELNIVLPQWSAALILVGGILGYGLDKYNAVLEAQNKLLENEKLRIELREQVNKMEEMKQQQSPQIYTIQEHLSQFNSQARSANIGQVVINGQAVYERKGGTDNR